MSWGGNLESRRRPKITAACTGGDRDSCVVRHFERAMVHSKAGTCPRRTVVVALAGTVRSDNGDEHGSGRATATTDSLIQSESLGVR